jgi:hypothetical protein
MDDVFGLKHVPVSNGENETKDKFKKTMEI